MLSLPIDHLYSLVVPAYDESPATVERLLRSVDPAALVVLVVNRGERSPASAKAGNDALIAWARERYGSETEADNLLLLRAPAELPDVLLVDRNRDGLTVHGGVGGARHVGADIAQQLEARGRIRSPWIHQTDCDCVLPADFFSRNDDIYTPQSALALRQLRAFSNDPRLQRVASIYDANAHLASIGLERAHAPWAWSSTLNGCAIAYSCWAYRSAGGILPLLRSEDAQIMTAVAMVGVVHRTFGEPVLTEARPISRPSGGFGKAVGDLSRNEGNMPATCAGAGLWRVLGAFYRAIELVTLSTGVTARDGARLACEELDCRESEADLVTLLAHFVSTLDFYRARMTPRDAYLTIHKQHDMYRAAELDFAIEGLEVRDKTVPLADVWRTHSWAGAADAVGWPAIVDAVYAREAEVCAGDTGPLAWTERLFG